MNTPKYQTFLPPFLSIRINRVLVVFIILSSGLDHAIYFPSVYACMRACMYSIQPQHIRTTSSPPPPSHHTLWLIQPLFPFFFPGTTLKFSLSASLAAAAAAPPPPPPLGPFFATSLHPLPLPDLISAALPGDEKNIEPVADPVPEDMSGMIPLSASLRRRTNSSAKRRPSSVWEEA